MIGYNCNICLKFNGFSKLQLEIVLEIQFVFWLALFFLMYIYICFVSVWNTCGRWFVFVVIVVSATENQHFDTLFLFYFNLRVHSCLTTSVGTEAVLGGRTCVCFSRRKIRSLADQFHYCIKYVQTVSALIGKWKLCGDLYCCCCLMYWTCTALVVCKFRTMIMFWIF